MQRSRMVGLLASLLLGVWSQSAGAQLVPPSPQLVIDDFSTGAYAALPQFSEVSPNVQPGLMLGKRRLTALTMDQTMSVPKPKNPCVAPNPFNQPVLLDIRRLGAATGVLVLNDGLKAGFCSLQVWYGANLVGKRIIITPLNVDLLGACGGAGCGKFRVTFDAYDLVLSVLLQVTASNTTSAADARNGANKGPLGHSLNPCVVDFPFTAFSKPHGVTLDFHHINSILLQFTSGSGIAANNFAITKVEAVAANAPSSLPPCK